MIGRTEMRKLKPHVAKLHANAAAFEISPALAWLMAAQADWNNLVIGIKQLNKGVALSADDIGIAALHTQLRILDALLAERG